MCLPSRIRFWTRRGLRFCRLSTRMPRIASGPQGDCRQQQNDADVHQRGGEPKIFDYADVLQCEVAEAGDPEAEEAVSKQEFAQRILANPAKAAKINAAKRNMCLGMGVVVAVQTGKDEVSKLEIPVMTDEVKRDSSLYKSYRNVAEKIKAEFDAMGGLA